MLAYLGAIGLVGFFVCLIFAIVSLFKKTKQANTYLLGSVGCLLLLFGSVSLNSATNKVKHAPANVSVAASVDDDKQQQNYKNIALLTIWRYIDLTEKGTITPGVTAPIVKVVYRQSEKIKSGESEKLAVIASLIEAGHIEKVKKLYAEISGKIK